MKFLTKRKGEALQIDAKVSVREDKLLNSLFNKDFTYNKRLYYYIKNRVLYLLMSFLLLLLFNNYKKGKVY
jgi:hypothetical protein